MRLTLDAFRADFSLQLASHAETTGELTQDSFFEVFTSFLVDSGEIETADRCFFKKRSMRIDGYGGDPIDTDFVLSVIVSDYSSSDELENVNRADIELVCKRATNFISNCLENSFFNDLDEASPEFGFADIVRQRWDIIQKIRVIFITNKSLSLRKAEFEPIPVNGINAEFTCWDINRLHSYVNSGKEREEISIELSEYGGAIAVLPAHQFNSPFKSYLCVMPGNTLANIYKKWGTRLLEKNVRVFLQAKGKVNKGIRNSLESEPEMFFAYNNGITATAEAISTGQTERGIALNSLHDFQIVNGGQTTASIFDAQRRGINLDNVTVQMKLSVVNQDKSKEVVPKISEYANSQNKVSSADFFSNHPFHIAIENFSRTIIGPPKPGTTLQTKWFYERARGQYQDARSNAGSTSERKKFDAIHPRSQLVTKTDLAKVLNTFRGRPDLVSKGAQKSFTEFAGAIQKTWEKEGEEHKTFNEQFFKHSMSKKLIYNSLEKLVSAQDWYQGGYRANVVTYALAKLIDVLNKKGKKLNLTRIWNQQSISKELEETLLEIAFKAYEHITTPPLGSPTNVTEYAKTSKCWDIFKNEDYILPKDASTFLINKSVARLEQSQAESKQKLVNEVDIQKKVIELGGPFWSSVLEFSSQNNLLTQRDWSLLSTATAIPSKLPSSDKDFKQLLQLLERARKRGFQK